MMVVVVVVEMVVLANVLVWAHLGKTSATGTLRLSFIVFLF